MIKISKNEAYSELDDIDVKVIDQELDLMFNSDQRFGREMTTQFFLKDEDTINLLVYWDGQEVANYEFKRKPKK